MKCPHCGRIGKPLVLETRADGQEGVIYRRRSCGGCGKGFVTREESAADLIIPERLRSRARAPKVQPGRLSSRGPDWASLSNVWTRRPDTPSQD